MSTSICYLLHQLYLETKAYHYISALFSSVVYLICALKAQSFLTSSNSSLFIRVPKRVARAKSSRQSAAGDGWISTTSSKRKRPASTTAKKRRASTGTSTRKRSASKGGKRRKTTKASSSGSKKPRAKKARTFPDKSNTNSNQTLDKFLSQAAPSAQEIIELDDSSSSLDESSIVAPRRASLPGRFNPASRLAAAKKFPDENDPLWDDDSEIEFE
jgi:hypothetical protein